MLAGSAGCVGVEVGVFEGAFSFDILTTKIATLHLVNGWVFYPEYGKDSCNRVDSDQEKIYRNVFNRFGGEIASGRVVVHRKMSVDASKDFEDGSLDFCYLDARHTFDAVLEDLEAWGPKIKPGGCLMGHDFSDIPQARELNFGVRPAVEQFCNETDWEMYGISEDHPQSFCLKRGAK